MHGNEPNKIFISAHNSESSSKTQAALRESTGVYPHHLNCNPMWWEGEGRLPVSTSEEVLSINNYLMKWILKMRLSVSYCQ